MARVCLRVRGSPTFKDPGQSGWVRRWFEEAAAVAEGQVRPRQSEKTN
jgi:hypothetical protein